MKIILDKTQLKSFTMLHLLGWIESVGDLLSDEAECPFSSTAELARQLDYWQQEFKKHSGNESIKKEGINITCYGSEVILIAKPSTGEHIILTVTLTPQLHGQY